MPEPLKTWIALDFEAFVTQVAFSKRDTTGANTVQTARFYNVFETNAISRRATPRLDCESIRELALTEPERTLNLTRDQWLSDEPISTSDDVPYDAENLLVELLSTLKDECKKLIGKNISDCVVTLPKRGELYDRIRCAATGAGFNVVMHRDRGICAAYDWAIENRPKSRRVLLCRVGYDATEIYVFKPRRDGLEDSSEHVRFEWEKLGLYQIVSKAAERVVSSAKKKSGSEKADEWRTRLPALLVEIDCKLREYLADPTPERAKETEILKVGSLKLKFPNSTLATALAKNNAKIAAGIKDVVASVTKNGKLSRNHFEILVSGDGASEALVDEIRNYFENVSLDKSTTTPAQGCVSFLKALPLPYEPETKEERKYVETYESAVRGDVESFLPLAKIYLVGYGTSKRYEEGVYWLKEADKYDDPEACEYLAECYRKGRGTTKNPKKESEARERAKRLRGYLNGEDDPTNRFEWRDASDTSSDSSHEETSNFSSGSRSKSNSRATTARSEETAYRRPSPSQSESASLETSTLETSTKKKKDGGGKKLRYETPRRVKEKIWGLIISAFVFFRNGVRIVVVHNNDTIPLLIGLTLLLVSLTLMLIGVVSYYRKRVPRHDVGAKS